MSRARAAVMLALVFMPLIAPPTSSQPPLEERYGLIADPALVERLSSVGERMAHALSRTSFTFKILNSETFYATAIFNEKKQGTVYVTFGLMGAVDDNELAFVVGHEMAHFLLKHRPPKHDAFGQGIYSAQQEQDADVLTLEAMRKAGFDPSVAKPFLERLKEGGDVAWLWEHPVDEPRLLALEREMQVKLFGERILIRTIQVQGEHAGAVGQWLPTLLEFRLSELGFAAVLPPVKENNAWFYRAAFDNEELARAGLEAQPTESEGAPLCIIDLNLNLSVRRHIAPSIIGTLVPLLLNIPLKPRLSEFVSFRGRLSGQFGESPTGALELFHFSRRTQTKPTRLDFELEFLPHWLPDVVRNGALHMERLNASVAGKLVNGMIDPLMIRLNDFLQRTYQTAIVRAEKGVRPAAGEQLAVYRNGKQVALVEVVEVLEGDRLKVKILQGRTLKLTDKARPLRRRTK